MPAISPISILSLSDLILWKTLGLGLMGTQMPYFAASFFNLIEALLLNGIVVNFLFGQAQLYLTFLFLRYVIV